MPRRACIFCGGRPLTLEHVYPAWLSNVLSRRIPPILGAELQAAGFRIGFGTDQHDGPVGSHTTTMRKLVHPKELRVLAKCVCAGCNGGWMREIEETARRYMEPMILGRAVDLTPDRQSALAAWIALRAMIIPHAHSGQRPVRSDWLAWMYEHHTAPPSWRAFAAAYRGRVPTLYEARAITVHVPSAHEPNGTVDVHRGVLTDFVTGQLSLKVVGLDEFPMSPLSTDFMLPLDSETVLHWPPRYAIGDETVEMYLGLFVEREISPLRSHFRR